MIPIPLFSSDGKELGTVPVDEAVFGGEIRRKLLREVVIWYQANRRSGTAASKGRSEVSGGGRKPWKQKHTGRARASSIRSPLWRHGGTIFGPHPRDYSVAIPQKMRRLALDSALLSKFRDREAVVVERFEFSEPKTRRMARLLDAIGVKRSCLIGVRNPEPATWLSARNLPRVRMARIADFNAYEVLRSRQLVLTRSALEFLLQRETSGAKKRAAAPL